MIAIVCGLIGYKLHVAAPFLHKKIVVAHFFGELLTAIRCILTLLNKAVCNDI